MNRFVVAVTLLSAGVMWVFGAWCRFAPESFARWANWPMHVHFLHDAGVFQMGIGLMMLAALRWRDVLTVVLGGFVFTNTAHAVNHFLDSGGGNASDPWLLLVLSGLAAVAWAARVRALGRRHSTRS